MAPNAPNLRTILYRAALHREDEPAEGEAEGSIPVQVADCRERAEEWLCDGVPEVGWVESRKEGA